jgi:hypothetical protein
MKSFRETMKKNRAEEDNASAGSDELLKKYSGMSENELMRELLNATGKQKDEGKFDPDSVKKGVNAIMPMLNAEQKRKLSEIIGKL